MLYEEHGAPTLCPVGALTRRDVLRWAGLGAAGLAVSACGENAEARPPGEAHAAAILEPDAGGFLVAIWTRDPHAVMVEVRRDGDEDVVASAVHMVDARGAAVEVGDLAPDTAYVVTISADDGVRLGPHRVRTAPANAASRDVRLAISADLDPHPEFTSDIVEHVIASAPELFVSLGDFPYTDNGPPAVTVDEYRERHALTRTEPRFRRLLESCGVRAIYDDHEFRNDWDAMFAATESARFAAAMQVWDEFFPVRGTAGSDIRYRRWRWGTHAELFLLDTRRYRSANAAPDDATKTLLGATQRAWLVDALQTSTATFKLVLSSVPLAYGNGVDHWSGFTTERDSLLAELATIAGVVVFSADQHWFASHRHVHGIREFQVGPLARGIGIPTVDDPGVVFRAARYNAAIVDVTADALTVSALGDDGEVFYKETLHIADLTPTTPQR